MGREKRNLVGAEDEEDGEEASDELMRPAWEVEGCESFEILDFVAERDGCSDGDAPCDRERHPQRDPARKRKKRRGTASRYCRDCRVRAGMKNEIKERGGKQDGMEEERGVGQVY